MSADAGTDGPVSPADGWWSESAGNTTGLSPSNRLSEEGYYITAFCLLFIATFGIFNNLVVIIVMVRNKKLRTPLNALLLSLAMSDLGISLVGSPVSLMAALHRGWYFGPGVCVGYAFLMSFFGIASITSLTVLSFERYLMISRPWRNSELTHRRALLIICCSWAYAFITTTPPLFGWGGFGIEGPGISCSIDWVTRSWQNTSYIVFLFVLGLGVPVVVMAFSYTNILLTLKQHGHLGLQSGVARAEKRVAMMVLVMVVTFLAAWTPYSVITLIMAFGNPLLVTPGAAVAPAICAKSSCLYNPIIYVGLNTQFRSAWSRLLCCREEGPSLACTTEKVSLTVFIDHGPQPESLKLRVTKRDGDGCQSSAPEPTEVTSLRESRVVPVKVLYDVQVSTAGGGQVKSEIV
nr:parapinopsin-like [Procambarus clarkii]